MAWTRVVIAGATLLAAVAIDGADAAYPGNVGRIAYTRTEAGASEIFSIAPDGAGEKQLTRPSSTAAARPGRPTARR